MNYWYFSFTYEARSRGVGISNGVIESNGNTFPLVCALQMASKSKNSVSVQITFWGKISELDYHEYLKTVNV